MTTSPGTVLHKVLALISVPVTVASSWGVVHLSGTSTSATPPVPVLSPAYTVVSAQGAAVPFGDAGNFGSLIEPPPSVVAPAAPLPPATTLPVSGTTTTSAPGSSAGSSQGSSEGQAGAGAWSPTLPSAPVVAGALSADGGGYWMVSADGHVYSFGDAGTFGYPSILDSPVVAMAATPDGRGYWIATADGGVLTYGDALYFGSTGDLDPALSPGGSNSVRLAKAVVAFVPTPDGNGYWLVGADGGVLTFGDAGYYGSTGALRLNRPIVAAATTPDGQGYWLFASDGGVFTFGDAAYLGSAAGLVLAKPIVAAATEDGRGYWMLSADGGIFTFGDAPYSGSAVTALSGTDSAVALLVGQPYLDGGSAAAREAVDFALSQVGVPYLYGGTGQGGYDCSGLVMVAYEHAGIQLPRTAQAQYDATQPVPPGVALLPGDILFFGTSTSSVTHDGIYIGNGEMVDAPHTGTDVRIESFSDWGDFLGATRPAP
jgi:cell wall-associated NlpC family hydrolase